MNLNNLMKTGALVAMMAIGVVGCNENTIDPGTTIGNVSALSANSLSATSVGLRWTASSTTGATYLVSYRKAGTTGAADSGSSASGTTVTVNGTTGATITGLTNGAYDFYVRTMSGTELSTGASIRWAPSTRYTNDARTPAVTLRMYEFASSSGSGLILDPAKTGPRNASVAGTSTDPAGSIALAIFTGNAGSPILNDSFDVGPAYAFVGFRNANRFDSSAYISTDGFAVNSLNELYLSRSLDTYITGSGAAAGNIKAFRLPPLASQGVAFLMRVGNGNDMHYARVQVKSVGGKLLQGTVPDRFVEVEISYQSVAGLPYAKGVVRQESVPSFTSRVLYPLNK